MTVMVAQEVEAPAQVGKAGSPARVTHTCWGAAAPIQPTASNAANSLMWLNYMPVGRYRCGAPAAYLWGAARPYALCAGWCGSM